MEFIDVTPTTRITTTLPVDVIEAVDVIASRVGCTRSAVIAHLLSSSCWDMLEVAEHSLPKRRRKAVSRRASGRSGAELGAIFDNLEEELRKRDIANWLSEGFELSQEQDGA